MATAIEQAPSAVHRGEADLPWVDDGRGTETKVLVAKEREGLWIGREGAGNASALVIAVIHAG